MMKKLILAISLIVLAMPLAISSAQAEVHEVKMLNKDPDDKKRTMVFIPAMVVIKPGDTVKFIAVDGGHNTETIKKMLPDGAKKWKSKFSKDFELVLDKPGVYGYRCLPHSAMGMVGLVIVKGDGWKDNLEAVKKLKHRGKAKKIFKALWAEVDKIN